MLFLWVLLVITGWGDDGFFKDNQTQMIFYSGVLWFLSGWQAAKNEWSYFKRVSPIAAGYYLIAVAAKYSASRNK